MSDAMMNQGAFLIAASAISLAVGGFVLSVESRSPLHRSFFLITAFGAIWLFTFGMARMAAHLEKAYFWLSLDYGLGVPFIAPSVYLFSRYWIGQQPNRISRGGFVIGAILGTVALLCSREIFDFVDISVGRYDRVRSDFFGKGFFYSLLFAFTAYSAMAFKNLIQAWRTAEFNARRSQCRVFLIAAAIGYTGTIDLFVADGVDVYPFGCFSFATFCLLIAYAIIRYRFLGFDVFIRKFSFVALIYSVLAALAFPIGIPLITQEGNPTQNLATLLLFSICSGLFFSLGPVIYLYLQRHSTWVRRHLNTGITHELKSPLSTIQGAVEILRGEMAGATGNGLAPRYIEMIESNARRLEVSIQNLLRFEKMKHGDFTVERSLFNFAQLVHEEVDRQRESASLRSIQIETTVEGESFAIEADKEKLRHAISNMLSNAIKYSNSEGTVFVSVKSSKDEIACSVRDTGVGMDAATLTVAFNEFFSGPNSSQGTGLGLTIARTWIEAHKGRIWAESPGLGRGSTITFVLPSNRPVQG